MDRDAIRLDSVSRRRRLRRQVLALPPPVDEREAASRAELLAKLEDLPRPFDRHAGPVHLTASGIVTGPRGVVLHLHRRIGLWLQPGGHLEAGEEPAAAALREGREETGLALRPPAAGPRLIHVDVHPAPPGHVHLDLRYLLLAEDEDPRPPADESPDARWFGWDEAMAIADAGLTGALIAARPWPSAATGSRPASA